MMMMMMMMMNYNSILGQINAEGRKEVHLSLTIFKEIKGGIPFHRIISTCTLNIKNILKTERVRERWSLGLRIFLTLYLSNFQHKTFARAVHTNPVKT